MGTPVRTIKDKQMELFITPLQFEKTAYIRVNENPTEWTRDVMEQFYNSFPYFMSFPVRVEFKQRDDQKGYAVGAIRIENGSGISVPIVIKNRELYPFDIAVFNGQIMPLNDYTIQSYLSGKSPFQSTVSRETGDTTTLLFNAGNIGYTREMPMETYKAASLLEQVLPNTTPAEREEVLKTAADPRVAEGYKQNGTAEAILKIAASTADAKPADIAEKVQALFDRDIWYIYKKADFEYRGIFGNSKVDDPIEFEMSVDDVAKMGQYIKTASTVKVAEAEDLTKIAGVFPLENSDASLVVFEDNDYVEVPTRLLQGHVKLASPSKIAIGETGTFQLDEKTFSTPFVVERFWSEGDGRTQHVEGSTSLKKVAYATHPSVTEKVFDAATGITWLPNNAPFFKLANCQKTTGNTKGSKNKVVKTAGGFVLDGEQLSSYIGTTQPVDMHKAAWALVQCGATETDVTKIAHMREGDTLFIYDELTVPEFSVAKNAAATEKELAAKAAEVKKISRNFIKEASAVTDLPTVDKVLALNFVNKDTIGTFIQAMPVLENAMFHVADMLAKARIGVELVNEGALRKIMFGLSDIVQVLKGVSTLKGN